MQLLVSVRSVTEAEAALAGGASLIDVKEPARGSLGRADDAVIAEVIRFVASRRPVSAALGELIDNPAPFAGTGLSYAKWGLAGWGEDDSWRRELKAAAKRLQETDATCRAVAVAYADWRRAQAPPPEMVAAFVREHRWQAFLIDTWHKDGTTLLDWLSLAEADRLCRAGGVRVALAGSLGLGEVATLRVVEPDWFAVRGAVCRGGRRGDTVDANAVRRLAERLASFRSRSTIAG